MIDFLRKSRGRYENDWLEEMSEIQLGDEKNTIGFEHRNTQGYGKIVSAYHNGLEYVIQTQDNFNKDYDANIRKTISSFQF